MRGGARSGEGAVTVVAATWLEAWAVRRAARGVPVLRAGVGLRRLRGPVPGSAVISCGLAGALRSDLPTGTVVVPDRVLRPDGTWLRCDPALGDALAEGARRLGFEPARVPLATVPVLARGELRAWWAARGCAAADMETGLLGAPRVAAVRVILDTPERDLPRIRDGRSAWREAVGLLREAPRCARRAAAVLAAALSEGPAGA